MYSRIGRDNYWQLWGCISRQSLRDLAIYQWSNYGTKLDVLFYEDEDYYQPEMEPIEEIDKIMRKKPKTRARG